MSTITYIRAIRYHQPVWGIEYLRKCLNHSYQRDDIGRHHGVHYNASDALKFAVMYDHLPYAKFLLENYLHEALDSNLCCPVILLAVQHGCTGMVELLCSFSNSNGILHKGKPYIDSCGCEAMENKKTALHISSELGNAEITKVLLQHGANVNMKDQGGLTPLDRVLNQTLNHTKTFQRGQPIRRSNSNLDRPTRFNLPRNRSRSRSPVSRTSSSESEPKYRAFTRSWSIIELLMAGQSTMSLESVENFTEIYHRRFGEFAEEEIRTKLPLSLMHYSRLTIRSALGRGQLPGGIYHLGLPCRMEKYVNLEPMSMEVTI